MLEKLKEDKKFLELNRLLNELQSKYALSISELIAVASDIKIPISIFSTDLGPLEVIVKFLHDNKGLSFVSIARLVGRTKQGIFQAYKSSKNKSQGTLPVTRSKFDIPVSILANRYSVLECIVKHLRDNFRLKFSQIGRLISRDPRTVWVVYNRTKKK